jgi:hypothetical protein
MLFTAFIGLLYPVFAEFLTKSSTGQLTCPDGLLGLKYPLDHCLTVESVKPAMNPNLLKTYRALNEGRIWEAIATAPTEEGRLALSILQLQTYDPADRRLSNCTHQVITVLLNKGRPSVDQMQTLSRQRVTSQTLISNADLKKRYTITADCGPNQFGTAKEEYTKLINFMRGSLKKPVEFSLFEQNKQRTVISVPDIAVVAYRTELGPPLIIVQDLLPLVLAASNACWQDSPGKETAGLSATVTSKSLGVTIYIVKSSWIDYF